MIRNPRFAAVLSIALAFGVVAVSMWTAHEKTGSHVATTRADMSASIDDDAIVQLLHANNVAIDGLSVRSAGGIVILRGTADTASAEQAVSIVKSLGVERVANLITTNVVDDEAIARSAERYLAATGSLAGCTLRVHCEKGVLSVTGTVQHELQKDAARAALRSVRGAREVRVDLSL